MPEINASMNMTLYGRTHAMQSRSQLHPIHARIFHSVCFNSKTHPTDEAMLKRRDKTVTHESHERKLFSSAPLWLHSNAGRAYLNCSLKSSILFSSFTYVVNSWTNNNSSFEASENVSKRRAKCDKSHWHCLGLNARKRHNYHDIEISRSCTL